MNKKNTKVNFYYLLFLPILIYFGKRSLIAYDEGRWSEIRRAQGESQHPTFRNAPEEILQVVYQKLADQTYAHYADGE